MTHDRNKGSTALTGGGGKTSLVSALLTKHYGGVVGHELDKPAGTVTSVDHHALTTAHLIKFRGDSQGVPVDDPMPTITSGSGAERPAGCPHALGLAAVTLNKFYGTNVGQDVEGPLHTVTGQGLKFGLVYAFGENYVQEGVAKVAELESLGLEWHFIGPLQSNKTRLVANRFAWVHSIDRLKIAERLSAQLVGQRLLTTVFLVKALGDAEREQPGARTPRTLQHPVNVRRSIGQRMEKEDRPLHRIRILA